MKGVFNMLLLTVTYEKESEDITRKLNEIKEYFAERKVIIGMSESLTKKTHFIKVYCDDSDFNEKIVNMFNLLFANILYNIILVEYIDKYLQDYLADTYYYLKYDELNIIKNLSIEAMKCEGALIDENTIYFLNRKNNIIKKIISYLQENIELNIGGYITFRIKDLIPELQEIIDKEIEKYMVEKEYNEFIKLLKYFVEMQESKIDEINIIIEKNGDYTIQDKKGHDIMEILVNDVSELKSNKNINIEDVLISGLITNCPLKIKIHCQENCNNKELIETIKNVFLDRVVFCNSCKICNSRKNEMRIKKHVDNE